VKELLVTVNKEWDRAFFAFVPQVVINVLLGLAAKMEMSR